VELTTLQRWCRQFTREGDDVNCHKRSYRRVAHHLSEEERKPADLAHMQRARIRRDATGLDRAGAGRSRASYQFGGSCYRVLHRPRLDGMGTSSGDGGAGTAGWIARGEVWVGGGGGGGSVTQSGSQLDGRGGGGNGGKGSTAGASGAHNSGGGGGGAGCPSPGHAGKGGSGTVIVRYKS